MKFMQITTVWCVVFLTNCFVAPAADSLSLTDGTSITGFFEKYNAGIIYFKNEEDKQCKYPLMKIESLSTDPSPTVNAKPRTKKKMENVKLKGYQKPKFIFEENGQTIEISGSEVSFIEIGMDFGRAMQIEEEKNKKSNDEEIDIEKMIKKGVVSVVHFYCPALRPLQQPDNYIVRLSEEKKIHLIQVNIGSWDSAVAKKYGIKSIPQFWFYDKKGNHFTNLVERFTGADIDETLKIVRRK